MIGSDDLQELDAVAFKKELEHAIEHNIFWQPMFHVEMGDGSIDAKQTIEVPFRTPQKLILMVEMTINISEAFSNNTEDGYHKCYEAEYISLNSFHYLNHLGHIKYLTADEIKDFDSINTMLKTVFDKLWICHYPNSQKSMDYHLYEDRIAI